MRLKELDLDKRLAGYSHDTLGLISKIMTLSRETLYKMLDITTDSELTEEEVVVRLKALLAEAENKK